MYEYVNKKEVDFARNEIEQIIHNVQDYLRENNILTFQYNLVGSASNHRHLVTRIVNGNQGFDMDYNIIIQQINDDYDNAKDIKTILMETFDRFLPKEFKNCENSSSVFTIKKVDKSCKKIKYSFDFAIVNYYVEDIENPNYDDDYDDPEEEYYEVERQQYISFNKTNNSYSWELRPIASDHRYMEQYVKTNGLWSELRELYIKHKNSEPTQKSRIIHYETLNQVYQKHFN